MGESARAGRADAADVRMPGFGLYAAGIFVWMTFVSCCGTTYMLPFVPFQADDVPYTLSQQASYVLTFFVVAFLAARRGKAADHGFLEGLWRLMFVSFVGFLACLLAFETGAHASWLTVVYGACLGVGMTLGYMQWTALIAARPHGEIVRLVLIASLASIASGTVLCFLPSQVRIVLASVVLMPASVALLRLYRVKFGSLPVAGTRAAVAQAPDVSPRAVFARLAPSAVCAVVLALVAPLVSTLYMGLVSEELARNLIAQAANLLAALVLAAVMLPSGRRVTIPTAYRALLPVLASAVLIGAFFPAEQRWFVLFFSEACFCVVSLLMLLEGCAIAHELNVAALFVYGVLGGLTYLARTPEALLALGPGLFGEVLSPVATAVLLYLLAIPSFALPLFSRMQDRAGGAQGVPSKEPSRDAEGLGTDEACARLARAGGLTPRQADVMRLLVKGVSTARIAQTLDLSESTVATYRKVVYAALGVHARQELLDLVEADARAGHAGAGIDEKAGAD